MTPNHDDDQNRGASPAHDDASLTRDANAAPYDAASLRDAASTGDAGTTSDAAARDGDPSANAASPASRWLASEPNAFASEPNASAQEPDRFASEPDRFASGSEGFADAIEPAPAMTDAEVASTLRESDPLSAEAARGPAVAPLREPSPLHEPSPLREPAPLRVSNVASLNNPTDPVAAAETHDGALRADDAPPHESPAVEESSAPIPFAETPIVDAPAAAEAVAVVGTSAVAETPAVVDAPAFVEAPTPPPATNEPSVEDVAPLAVAAAAAVAAPVVVRTKTGPVALDVQPEPTPAARPAPVVVRGLEPKEPATIAAGPVAIAKPARLASLDIFRGLTITLMVLVNNPGSWGNLYGPLKHAEWHGWTLTDLVFPFFLFIVGVATPFSLGKRHAIGGDSRAALLGHIWLRALALIVLGILLSGSNLPLPFQNEPAGFPGTKLMRLFGFGFVWLSIIALLVPWKKRAVSNALPVAVTLGLVGYCVGMHLVRAEAIKKGWPASTFGGGVFNPDRLRLPGVLQRIGLCYGVAASVALLLGRFGAWVFVLATIGVYSWLMLGVSFKGSTAGSLAEADNFQRAVDVFVFDRSFVNDEGKTVVTQKHTYGSYPDPEGLVSTLPAIATTLIGVLAGFWLRRGDRSSAELCAGLMARGVGVAIVGVLLSWWLMPINKNLWTPPYAVLTAGLGMLALGAVYWTADVRGRRWFFWPFKVMGMNAIAAFVASVLVLRIAGFFPFAHPRTGKTTTAVPWLKGEAAYGLTRASEWASAHAAWLPTLDTAQNASLAGAVAFVCVIFALMLALYVCRIFVKV